MSKKLKKTLCVLSIFLMLTSLFACSNKKGTEKTTDVVISLESDGVYGIVIEYSVDRTRLGGQMASCDPEMTKPLPKEEHTIKFAEQGFGEPYTLDSGKFGILVVVVLENGEEVLYDIEDDEEWEDDEDLTDLFDEENPLYEITCPKCGEEITTFFRFGPEFFRPTTI